MKISEVIAELERLKEEHGDIEVVGVGNEDPYFERNTDEDEVVLVVE